MTPPQRLLIVEMWDGPRALRSWPPIPHASFVNRPPESLNQADLALIAAHFTAANGGIRPVVRTIQVASFGRRGGAAGSTVR